MVFLFICCINDVYFIVSSVTMVLAVEAAHSLDKKGVIKWLFLTVVGGFFFVGSQAWEWYHFIHGSHFGSILTSQGWAVVDFNEANELILNMGRGVSIVGAEALLYLKMLQLLCKELI